VPTTEGSQATSSITCRTASASDQTLSPRRACSPSQRSLTSISAATASQCSTKSGTSAPFDRLLIDVRKDGFNEAQHCHSTGSNKERPPSDHFSPNVLPNFA